MGLEAKEKGNVTALPSSILQSQLVFPRFAGERSNIVTKWWERTVKAVGLEAITFHAATRHSFATRLVEAGVDLLTVASLMGHSTSAETA